jgi:ABC-2 type transport system ATP-binding protein
MLEALGLSKTYDAVLALDSLYLTVEPGEIYCLLGANGAGKTTTIHLFLDFLRPSAGRALVNGLEVSRHPLETKQFLAYIPEQVMLYRHLTGVENLAYFSALAGHGKYSRQELLDILGSAGLRPDAAIRRVSTYSKGMRQKVGIAIAVAKRARAMLLDEPTSGLDPQAANEFSQLLKALSQSGIAVLMATHDLFRAKEVGTRVGIMRQGRLLATHRTDELGHADLERLYLDHMRN